MCIFFCIVEKLHYLCIITKKVMQFFVFSHDGKLHLLTNKNNQNRNDEKIHFRPQRGFGRAIER